MAIWMRHWRRAARESPLLAEHLPSVEFDEIKIVAHGTPKSQAVLYGGGILFDDEQGNRNEWQGQAYDEKNILEILRNLVKNA